MEINIYYFSQVPMHSLDFGRADYLPIVSIVMIVTMHSLVWLKGSTVTINMYE